MPKQTDEMKGSPKLLLDMTMKRLLNKCRQIIIMNLLDKVLEGGDRSYCTCGHKEHLSLPVIQTYIHLRGFCTC